MISEGIFEEYTGPNEWISNPVIIPKDDGSIRITIDYRNVNKHLINTHNPIPRIDDLRAAMNGCKYFSKLDLNQAFFQFELSPESTPLTTFYANGRLMRLTRLPQGVLPACSELNNVLRQLFSHIPEVNAIHDDILIATENLEQHYTVLEKVLQLLESNNLTLNASKCIFVSQDIPFWGMRFTTEGIKPSPEKCKALQENGTTTEEGGCGFIHIHAAGTCQIYPCILQINGKYQKTSTETCTVPMDGSTSK